MYKNIVFDVDGTLIDTGSRVKEVYQKLIYEEFGRYFTDEEMANGSGQPTADVLKTYGFKNVPDAVRKHHDLLIQAFTQVKVYEGMIRTLDILKSRNITTGIATARGNSELQDDVTYLKIAKYFDFVISADDTEKYKPEPEPLLLFFKQANAKSNETLYIGDTWNDYMCAKNADTDFALALWGASGRDGIHAKYFLEHPRDIADILDR